MPEYDWTQRFTAADDAQAERLVAAWSETCAAEYGTRHTRVLRLSPDDENAALDAAILARAEATPIGEVLASEGVTTVGLDADGRLVEHRPDGTSVVIEQESRSNVLLNRILAEDAGFLERLARADADQSHPMTPDQHRSLLLGYAVAGRLVTDPDRALRRARESLELLRASSSGGTARVWLEEWERLLDGPLPVLLEVLTSTSELSRDLRQNSPFAGVLPDEDRLAVLRTGRSM